MKNLNTLSGIVPDPSRISDAKLYSFSTDHFERLKLNNPGNRYESLITQTHDAISAYYAQYVIEESSRAVKEGSTVNTLGIHTEAKEFISRQEGTIRGIFGKKSAIYQEFYPHGTTEYRQAPMDIFTGLLDRYIHAVSSHAAQLPQDFKTSISDIKTRYELARTAQVSHKGAVKMGITVTAQTRYNLCVQLTRNLLIIASDHVGEESFADLYCNQAIIRPHRNQAGNIEIEGEPGPGEKYLVTDEGFNASSLFMVTNQGSVSLKFYMAASPADEVPTTAFEIAAGTSAELSPAQLGNANDTCLMCYNPSTTSHGSFIAEVKEKVK